MGLACDSFETGIGRLQRLAANNALVSGITFEALSLANQELGELNAGDLEEVRFR